ncbi:MAG: Asp-tRNA(Asn)/Glu-tRNA(Gln) amidotransferase subunit GatA [Desulfobulbus sp.]|uniref:Asp-tRNA(Asn)/Glu-tRNA(Gln) amidotransferase subunit GatA n=1 Tax=uncultured Desulfobulbus sp. TaxID=239745 RepID=UPI001B6A3595|nr:Asp-tRNA(Asn)/Glu-tRNA(Gln) amidotransferase subunit GatA [uncultured Desulfobulbus sp.]MBP7516238.1 Asp-tRNA(Asn)/Glu-tRNA(Gln) amidotransferase subunit GatA [Desulfobulbus sp.]
MDLHSLTLHEAQQRLVAGDLTAVRLTEAVLERIDSVEPTVRAFLSLDRQGALRQAEAADAARAAGRGGPLCGLPLALKDVLCTTDLPTTCGSRMLEHFVAPYDATVVTRLREAGAVLLGKLAMDEFAMGSTSEHCAFQVVQNPWKPGHVAGGSSGGSAAAVAADECLASLGSDTGGSIRQPASLCGTVGLKPTYGRVSRYGLVAFASSLDQVGPLTKDVRDCALMLNAICGHDPLDSTSIDRPVPDFTASLQDGLQGVRVGVPREYFGQGLDPEVERVARAAIAMLQEAGAEIVEVTLPHTDYCVAVYYLIAPAEASSNLARFDGVRYGYRDRSAGALIDLYNRSRSQGFGDEVKRRILIGTYALSAGYYDAYYKKASQVRTLIKEDFARAYASCDLLVSPVVPTPAWQIGAGADDPLSLYLSDILTLSANLAGTPGMSVPCGFSSQGLPIGVQLQAAHFQEEILLRAAHNLEQRAGVTGRKPPLA